MKQMFLIAVLLSLVNCTTTQNLLQSNTSHSYPYSSNLEAPESVDKQAKQFISPEGQALLYIIKPGPRELGHRLDVYLDGDDIGSVHKDQFIFTAMTPGNHRLKTTAMVYYENRTLLKTEVRWTGLRVAEYNFTAAAGQIYFFEQVYSSGNGSNYNDFMLRPLPQKEGRELVLSLRLGKFNKYLFTVINPNSKWSGSPEPCIDGESHPKNLDFISCIYD